jgi:hypothetical protein
MSVPRDGCGFVDDVDGMPATPSSPPIVLLTDAEVLARLRAMVEQHGVSGAAKRLGVGREAVARVLAGVEVRAGSMALLRERLSTREHAA